MASTHKHIRSSTANKRPTTAIADGQIALNTNASSPGLFFKDSTGASIIKIGPVHVGSTAPNATPGAGGSSGNSTGEIWLDNSLTPVGVKIWNGSAWVNATPVGSTTVQGLLELATSAETQTGTDTDRAVTPAGLQSKLSDSTSTTSSTTIASSTAVKSAYDLANAALPKSGGTITGNLEIGTTGSLSFEGSTADAFETTIAVTDPTADRTITLPDTTGTVVTTGDTGTVTSTMIANGTIVDADINASAAIAHSKLANITAASVLLGNASNVPTATALTGDVTVTSSGVTSISSGVIVNADVNASAAIAGTKISPDFGSQTITTTGVVSAALGAAATPSITFTGDLNTGIYSPGADQVAISTGGSGRLFVDASGNVILGTTSIVSGASGRVLQIGTTTDTASTLQFAATTTGNSYIQFGDGGSPESYAGYLQYTHTDNALLFGTNKQERLRITSAGLVGIGTSSPSNTAGFSQQLELAGNIPCITINQTNAGFTLRKYSIGVDTVGAFGIWDNTPSAYRLYINSSGNVGIGTTAPGAPLSVNGNTIIGPESGTRLAVNLSENDKVELQVVDSTSTARAMAFTVGATEAARIDSSGRLLVGTSSTSAAATILAQGNSSIGSTGGGIIVLSRGEATPGSGVALGEIRFADNTHTNSASIQAYRDGGTWSGSSKPTLLAFSTTADGASSPTERMRIGSDGWIYAGTTSKTLYNSSSGQGLTWNGGELGIATTATTGIYVNRTIDDGELISFFQSGTKEGNISVSGTTVSYNGAHLSRWSQLPNGAERTEILRGSVLSNIDEMCEWGEEDNEQLNRMKVSDLEGDKNVSGVFQCWDDADDTYINDFYCAMTGDFIIRIAEGVTVERGDLLMSAGDGTAKPQDDDIIRSKTIAKVTSTNVSCTYEDGSYCVPCVLMAC